MVLKIVGCAMVASCALAQPVEFSGMSSITESGQMFTFDVAMAPASLGEGTLVISGLGDYSIVPPSSETMDWDLDGIASGRGFNASAFADPSNVDLFQNAVSQTFMISAADMAAITADGAFTLTIQNGSAVNFFANQAEDFIAYSLSYNAVPAPAALSVLGLGGLVATRRRR